MSASRLRASPRHGGAIRIFVRNNTFFTLFPNRSLIRRGEAPSGAAAFIVMEG